MPWGIQAAQIIHAAGESSPGDLPTGTYAIALHAEDEAHLERIRNRLEQRGVSFTAITENSGKFHGQLMALGIAPRPRSELRRLFSSLPLVK